MLKLSTKKIGRCNWFCSELRKRKEMRGFGMESSFTFFLVTSKQQPQPLSWLTGSCLLGRYGWRQLARFSCLCFGSLSTPYFIAFLAPFLLVLPWFCKNPNLRSLGGSSSGPPRNLPTRLALKSAASLDSHAATMQAGTSLMLHFFVLCS